MTTHICHGCTRTWFGGYSDTPEHEDCHRCRRDHSNERGTCKWEASLWSPAMEAWFRDVMAKYVDGVRSFQAKLDRILANSAPGELGS